MTYVQSPCRGLSEVPWIERVINCLPESPESVGAWVFTVGAIGAATAFYLHDFPLTVGSTFLYSAGALGPRLLKLKRKLASLRNTPMTEEEEDAMVEAGLRGWEAEERIRETRIQQIQQLALSEPPPPHRLH